MFGEFGQIVVNSSLASLAMHPILDIGNNDEMENIHPGPVLLSGVAGATSDSIL